MSTDHKRSRGEEGGVIRKVSKAAVDEFSCELSP